jgi:segregation and condensation protein A
MTAEILSFETGRPAELAEGEPALVVDVEGYEGPLDLLLALARQQKVDLAKISILALADQYLQFIEAARKIRLELAADYLVMAAWLAFLKSRLLLPEPATAEGPSAEEMATALANRLRHLEGIREASNRLLNRPQLQRDIFPRGFPETIAEIRHPKYTATLFDLLTAYAAQRQQRVLASVHLAKRTVWSLAEARASLNISSITSSIPRKGPRCLPRASPRRWSSSGKGRSNCISRRPSPRCFFESARRSLYPTPRRRANTEC